MKSYEDKIAYLIKTIFWKYPGEIKLKSDGTKKVFDLDYFTSEKVSKEMRRSYYFGTELKTDSFKEYLGTFKELSKVKRALKNIK